MNSSVSVKHLAHRCYIYPKIQQEVAANNLLHTSQRVLALTCVDQCPAALCVCRECQNDELDDDSHITSQLQNDNWVCVMT